MVRHGETDWNVALRYQGHGPVPLNAHGREQARRTGARLRPRKIAALYASDIARAWETAQIIGDCIGLAPQALPDLREVDVGQWQGLTPAELDERFPQHMREYRRDPANTVRMGGESYAQLQARAMVALHTIQERHYEDGMVVAVAHGGTIRAILCALLEINLIHFGRMWLDNGSLTELRYTNEQWRVYRVNDAAHLEGQTFEAQNWYH
jgi:broad specificity phosphatase PhoE